MKNPTIKLMAVSVFAAAVASCSGCATPSQMYWDHKVKELCEKDGGVTVYEKIELTKDKKIQLKIAPSKKYATSEYDYFYESKEEIINEMNPSVKKYISYLYRNSDKKLIAVQIDYGRVGGDIPSGIGHDSSYNCDRAGVSTQITKSVFFIKGE